MFLWCILLNFDLLRQSLLKTECDRRNINPDRKIEYELKNKKSEAKKKEKGWQKIYWEAVV